MRNGISCRVVESVIKATASHSTFCLFKILPIDDPGGNLNRVKNVMARQIQSHNKDIEVAEML